MAKVANFERDLQVPVKSQAWLEQEGEIVLSVRARLKLIELILNELADHRDVGAEFTKYCRSELGPSSVSKIHKWVHSDVINLAEDGRKLLSQFTKITLPNEMKCAEHIASGYFFKIAESSDVPNELLKRCLPNSLKRLNSWSLENSTHPVLPIRSASSDQIRRIRNIYCGKYFLYRKSSRVSGVSREVVDMHYRDGAFKCIYYGDGNVKFFGDVIFEKDNINLVFSIAETNKTEMGHLDDRMYYIHLTLIRNDKSDILAGISCSTVNYQSTDPAARRVVLCRDVNNRIERDNSGSHVIRKKLSEWKSQEIVKIDESEEQIKDTVIRRLNAYESEAITYYAAVANYTPATREKDFHLITTEQFVGENIREGEVLYSILWERPDRESIVKAFYNTSIAYHFLKDVLSGKNSLV